jgi:transposase
MVKSKTAPQRAPRRRLSVENKRSIVELTLRPGASVAAVARDHSISRHTLAKWRDTYHSGSLGSTPAVTLLPVAIAAPAASAIDQGSRVEITFSHGVTMRIEAPTSDAATLCALIAQLR